MVLLSAGYALNLKELKLLGLSDDILSTIEHLSLAHLSANRDNKKKPELTGFEHIIKRRGGKDSCIFSFQHGNR